jgi:hypothetical protein
MKNKYLITVEEFCEVHNIDTKFVMSLQKSGLIEFAVIKETTYFKEDQVQLAEKYLCFYNEMNINLEGIETIAHLLQLISELQREMIALRNRLRLFETKSQK